MVHKQTIQKLKNKSSNITFAELASLLESLGFHQENKGETSGSRVKFLMMLAYLFICINRIQERLYCPTK